MATCASGEGAHKATIGSTSQYLMWTHPCPIYGGHCRHKLFGGVAIARCMVYENHWGRTAPEPPFQVKGRHHPLT